MIKNKLRWLLIVFLVFILPLYVLQGGVGKIIFNTKEWWMEFKAIYTWE
jgi:hypothetical protein